MSQQDNSPDAQTRGRWACRTLALLTVLVALGAAAGCATQPTVGSELEQVRAICEARDGHTELLYHPSMAAVVGSIRHICYEITDNDDGQSLCSRHEQVLQLRNDEIPDDAGRHNFDIRCGN